MRVRFTGSVWDIFRLPVYGFVALFLFCFVTALAYGRFLPFDALMVGLIQSIIFIGMVLLYQSMQLAIGILKYAFKRFTF